MQKIAMTLALGTLAACGGSSTGPGEIAGFGLVYDQRPGRSFEGLPRTTAANMPTGSFTMTGPSRATASDGTLVFADATLRVDTAADTVNYTARYDFPASAPVGVVAVNLDAALDDTGFQSSTTDRGLSGDFYGTAGTVAAGFWNVEISDSNFVNGAFIVGRN